MPNKSSPHGAAICEGSISTGTLKTQDLLRSFAAELKRIFPFNGAALANEACEAAAAMDANEEALTVAAADDILFDLIEQLDTIASHEGLYFGHLEGDAANFGFWKLENGEG